MRRGEAGAPALARTPLSSALPPTPTQTPSTNHSPTHPPTLSPRPAARGLYYALNIGPVHLLMTNTETALDTPDIDPTQLAFITADLAGVDHAATPITIVGGHRPMYCSNGGTQCGSFAAVLRNLTEAPYNKYGVDVVVTAHEHGYERTFRVVNSVVTDKSYLGPGAPVYIVNGAAGNREGNEKPSGAPWSAVQSGAVGYSLITVQAPPAGTGNATVHWQHYESDTGALLDDWTLSKAV